MAMAARLVPWTIAGMSLVVLGILVVLNPYLEASTASITGGPSEPIDAPPLFLGLALIGVGAFAALMAMLREPRNS